MASNIVHKPITNNEFKKLFGTNCLTDLMLMTGARIQEIHTLINLWDGVSDYLDIHTKMSGKRTNRIYLTDNSMKVLSECQKLHFGVTSRTLSSRVKTISESVGIIFTSHNLRATFATRLFEKKVDIITVSTLMNHGDIEITAKYIHFTEMRLRRGLSRLDDDRTYEGKSPEELLEDIYAKNAIIKELEDKLYELGGHNE